MKPYDSDRSKKQQVREMFDNIAPRYDLLNHTLSMNIDRLWRRNVVRLVRGLAPKRIMDVATGTGDLAIAMAKGIPEARIEGIDLSPEMLEVARRKVAGSGLAGRVSLAVGDAENLPVEEGSFDVATVAFGVRNFGDLELGLRELHRSLRKGGTVVILEFSRPRKGLFRSLYEWYSGTVLPRIGGMISRDRRAYEYLPASVREFPSPDRFIPILESAGFTECRARSQSFGIAQIYTGTKN